MLVPAPLVLLEAKAAKVKILNKLIRDNNRIYFDQSESRHLLLYYNKGSTLNFCFPKTNLNTLSTSNSNVLLGT